LLLSSLQLLAPFLFIWLEWLLFILGLNPVSLRVFIFPSVRTSIRMSQPKVRVIPIVPLSLTYTYAMDTFQDSSQLLMWWPFTEASQAIHRRVKFGACIWHLVQPTNPIYPIVFY
jgi:hypothetical protein